MLVFPSPKSHFNEVISPEEALLNCTVRGFCPVTGLALKSASSGAAVGVGDGEDAGVGVTDGVAVPVGDGTAVGVIAGVAVPVGDGVGVAFSPMVVNFHP